MHLDSSGQRALYLDRCYGVKFGGGEVNIGSVRDRWVGPLDGSRDVYTPLYIIDNSWASRQYHVGAPPSHEDSDIEADRTSDRHIDREPPRCLQEYGHLR